MAARRVFHRRRELLGEFLAELHTPLIERVDSPDHTLGEDFVLIPICGSKPSRVSNGLRQRARCWSMWRSGSLGQPGYYWRAKHAPENRAPARRSSSREAPTFCAGWFRGHPALKPSAPSAQRWPNLTRPVLRTSWCERAASDALCKVRTLPVAKRWTADRFLRHRHYFRSRRPNRSLSRG